MKQYRVTSANFVIPGEQGHEDAVMDSADLAEIKRLAGIVTEEGMWTGNRPVPNAAGTSTVSPVGSTVNPTAENRRELMAKYHARPGTDLWFIINFTKPYLNGSIESKVLAYLKQHPEYLPKKLPPGV